MRNSSTLKQAKGGIIDITKDFYLDTSRLRVRESKMPPLKTDDVKTSVPRKKTRPK
jgi:hypothetical protein